VITKSCKYDFMPLEKAKISAPTFRLKARPLSGFTLIEILVAITLIATIVSMVYGSYFATAKSAGVYKARMTVSNKTRKVLDWMTRQIRCSYISRIDENKDSAKAGSESLNEIRKNPVSYFSYESDTPGSGILHLVTTHKLFYEGGYANGLFDVAYKFDNKIGTLYLSQRRFTGTSEKYFDDRNWRPILTNIESMELEFFDGQRWDDEWDFAQKSELPFAVKIDISCLDENDRQCHYGTVVYLDCSRSQKSKVVIEKSVNKL
jgi:prepilin-type N-terminal cleavage/methylation domain-containing protein